MGSNKTREAGMVPAACRDGRHHPGRTELGGRRTVNGNGRSARVAVSTAEHRFGRLKSSSCCRIKSCGMVVKPCPASGPAAKRLGRGLLPNLSDRARWSMTRRTRAGGPGWEISFSTGNNPDVLESRGRRRCRGREGRCELLSAETSKPNSGSNVASQNVLAGARRFVLGFRANPSWR